MRLVLVQAHSGDMFCPADPFSGDQSRDIMPHICNLEVSSGEAALVPIQPGFVPKIISILVMHGVSFEAQHPSDHKCMCWPVFHCAPDCGAMFECPKTEIDTRSSSRVASCSGWRQSRGIHVSTFQNSPKRKQFYVCWLDLPWYRMKQYFPKCSSPRPLGQDAH